MVVVEWSRVLAVAIVACAITDTHANSTTLPAFVGSPMSGPSASLASLGEAPIVLAHHAGNARFGEVAIVRVDRDVYLIARIRGGYWRYLIGTNDATRINFAGALAVGDRISVPAFKLYPGNRSLWRNEVVCDVGASGAPSCIVFELAGSMDGVLQRDVQLTLDRDGTGTMIGRLFNSDGVRARDEQFDIRFP